MSESREKTIPLSVPNLKGNELRYVSRAIEEEWVSTGGSYINEFEKMTAEYVSAAGAAACQSGTAGIHLALIACGVGKGDEVIVPALTFIAAVNPVRYQGAEPVFMDCDDSLCMDMDKTEQFCEEECSWDGRKLIHKVTGRPVRAMIVVHVFGGIADMEKAADIARKYNLVLIEDATEALGSRFTSGRYKGEFAGTIGDAGVYSYNGNKIITTGGGGMVVSNDTAFLEKVKYLSTQAKDDPLYYVHDNIGYNYRMTSLQAALGLAQMEQLEKFIEIKKKNYDLYREKGIDLLPFRDGIRSNHWFYSYMTDRRDDLIRYLLENNIQSRPVWGLIPDQKPYRSSCRYRIDKAECYRDRIVNIPCSIGLTENEISRVAEALKRFEARQM